MMDSNKSSRTHSLILAVVLILFMAACMCIMPGLTTESASASSGSGWVDQTPIPDGKALNAVDAVDANVAWAAGSGSTMFKTTDGGATWVQQDAGDDIYRNIYDVSAVDADTAWASGTDFPNTGLLMKTTDGGDTWTSLPSAMATFKAGTTPTQMFVDGVAAIDADSVFVAVRCYYLNQYSPIQSWSEAKIWKTDDGGESWTTKLHTFVPGRIYRIDAVDDQVIWVAAGSGGYGSPPTVFVTYNGGWTWEFRYLDVFETYGMVDISAIDDVNAWAVYKLYQQNSGGIKKTSDGGTTWRTKPFAEDVWPRALSALDTDRAWVVGEPGIIYKSVDGGINWITQDSGVTVRLNDVCAVDPDTAWAVGENGVILKTTDGGGGAPGPFTITSVTPSEGTQNTFLMDITAEGSGFQPGATLRLEKDGSAINAINVTLSGETQISGTIGLFGVEAGAYDVVVTNLDSSEARLEDAFTVTTGCGAGSGTALLMLGLTLGLLSLAGTMGNHRRKIRRDRS